MKKAKGSGEKFFTYNIPQSSSSAQNLLHNKIYLSLFYVNHKDILNEKKIFLNLLLVLPLAKTLNRGPTSKLKPQPFQ